MNKKVDDNEVYGAIESFVGTHSADELIQHYQIASRKDHWKMAIQVHIACGERKDLEKMFPEWAGANPDNHNWGLTKK